MVKYLLILFCILSLVSCYNPRPHHNIDLLVPPIDDDIQKEQLEKLIQADPMFFGDTTYWMPSKSYILNIVYPYYKSFLDTNNVFYDKRFDCDDFARTFCVMAHLYYFNFMKIHSEQDAAIAEVWYVKDFSSGDMHFLYDEKIVRHAINLIVLQNKVIMFFEPQTGKEVHLSKTEIASIYIIKF
jgi:hypothetical protein